FTAPGKATIRLEALYGPESTRGAPMPAILLSYDAHRQGRLHLNRLRNWGDKAEELDGSPGQGEILHEHYKDALPEDLRNPKPGTDLGNPPNLTGAPARSENEVASAIHTAMTETYRWMFDKVMGPALDEALPVNEVAYYRGAVATYPVAIA